MNNLPRTPPFQANPIPRRTATGMNQRFHARFGMKASRNGWASFRLMKRKSSTSMDSGPATLLRAVCGPDPLCQANSGRVARSRARFARSGGSSFRQGVDCASLWRPWSAKAVPVVVRDFRSSILRHRCPALRQRHPTGGGNYPSLEALVGMPVGLRVGQAARRGDAQQDAEFVEGLVAEEQIARGGTIFSRARRGTVLGSSVSCFHDQKVEWRYRSPIATASKQGLCHEHLLCKMRS
jgi:hypothetical protein